MGTKPPARQNNIIKALVFTVLFCLLFSLFAFAITPMKDNQLGHRVNDEPKETIDMLFVGSSQFFLNVNPNVLWDEAGIAAYVHGASVQTMDMAYHYLKEALKTQSPKVVAIDAHSLVRFTGPVPDPYIHLALDAMPFSWNKLQLALALTPAGDNVLTYLTGVPVYHTEWKEQNAQHLLAGRHDYASNRWKGFSINYFHYINPMQPPAAAPVTSALGELPPKYLAYFQNILELSRQEGFRVVVIQTPDLELAADPAMQARLNTLHQMAAQGEFDLIDYTLAMEDIGFDYSRDFGDFSHMSGYGSTRFSRYIAPLLQEQFALPDRRGDERYASWDEAAAAYFAYARQAFAEEEAAPEEPEAQEVA